ncbi:ABC transporter permease/substrate-binding protein [Noviherbaspirillum pedocola]|uniref:ABC transporter permease subunit n=1 Tax=Noviherbaspirillum pedocola TaxID=2801341 RepID=A0A934SRZ6_9BURK|nr:glycine betaine ABC transporter substrate-binding protein [Noviherbaspirillum pedocola]MBK4735676.1 ABC transporter permease subunit [Noviherbaspirillum pedocola]
MHRLLSSILLAFLALCCLTADAQSLRIGSKRFTESYILGEILRMTASAHAPAEHRMGLGNTAILYEALRAGEIDLYPEYLGTITREILHSDRPATLADINAQLAPLGLAAGVPLGFSDSYGLAMREDLAQRLGITRISDLAAHTQLRYGLSHEFLGRTDGWPGLTQRYQLRLARPGALDHGLAYDALQSGQIDVTDVYTTDARIEGMHLRVLDDDLHYFPDYDAVLLYRSDLPHRLPAAWHALESLRGRIDQRRMIALNAAVELHGASFEAAARVFVDGGTSASSAPARGFLATIFNPELGRLTAQHLFLVCCAVVFATVVGIPLGITAAHHSWLRQPVLGLSGVLQTIPSLALFAMLIPLFGRIGTLPAVVALSLYALLPVVRNTCVGMLQVPAGLKLAALGLGLSVRDRMLQIELPLAAPMILAGIRTAAVMSVGTATIAAFIGAGGYGERIAIGLALNDRQALLAGAIPAAALALLTEAAFAIVEYLLRRRRPGAYPS